MNFKINTFGPVLAICLGIYALTAGNLIKKGLITTIDASSDEQVLDTVPRRSIYPRDTTDPINLKLPPDIEKGYDYDPELDSYFESTIIGSDYLDAPIGMTFTEYMEAKRREQ